MSPLTVGKRRCRCGPFWPTDGDVVVTPRIKAGQVPDSWAFTKDPGRSLRGSSAGQRHQSDAFGDASLAEIVVQPEEIAEHRLADLHTALTMLRKPIRLRVRAATRGHALCFASP